MKRKILEKICEEPKNIFNLLAGASGLSFGIIDTLTTGYPLFSIGLPIYQVAGVYSGPKEMREFGKSFAEDFLGDSMPSLWDKVKNYMIYGLYAGIPFAIKYHDRIIDLFRS